MDYQELVKMVTTENQHLRAEIAAARREGVIEGLERALEFSNSSVDRMDIRAEIERLREKKP